MSSNDAPLVHQLEGSRRLGDALSVVALVVAFVALGLSAWAAFRPAPNPGKDATFSSAQQADAKGATCRAADLVRKGVSINTNLQNPGGDGDVVGLLAVAANARLSLSAGGQYLLARTDPATPPELAESVKKFANTLMDIGAAATVGALNSDQEQSSRLREADAENTRVAELCK